MNIQKHKEKLLQMIDNHAQYARDHAHYHFKLGAEYLQKQRANHLLHNANAQSFLSMDVNNHFATVARAIAIFIAL